MFVVVCYVRHCVGYLGPMSCVYCLIARLSAFLSSEGVS